MTSSPPMAQKRQAGQLWPDMGPETWPIHKSMPHESQRPQPEQIIHELRTAEQLLNPGQAVDDICRALKVFPAT